MSGWNTPPKAAVPPHPGVEPPPGVGMSSESPEVEPEAERAEEQARWAEAAKEADEHRTTEELRRDAEHTRERINSDVDQLRHRFGIDDESRARRQSATGPFAPAKRHPFTVAMAGVGAAFAGLFAWRMSRNHRRNGGRRPRSGTRVRRMGDARRELIVTAADLAPRRRKGLRRLTHR
ncbi:hypothetical protein GCM10027447_11440 [Glycomyces halotolerans]